MSNKNTAPQSLDEQFADARTRLKAFVPQAPPFVAQLAALTAQIDAATAAHDVATLAPLLAERPALERVVDELKRTDATARQALEATLDDLLTRSRERELAGQDHMAALQRQRDALSREIATQVQTCARTDNASGSVARLKNLRGHLARVDEQIARHSANTAPNYLPSVTRPESD
jgi:chromosome segregation ATPase